MLIVALVLAVIGLAALVTAVVSSNEIVAWVCIGASALGVILLVVDAIRERQRRAAATAAVLAGTATATTEFEESGQEAETVGDVTPQGETDDDGPVSEQQAEIDSEIGTEEFGDAGSADETPEVAAEEHPDEVVHDEPEFDTYSDDEPEYPPSAEESAVHTVDESELNRAESEER